MSMRVPWPGAMGTLDIQKDMEDPWFRKINNNGGLMMVNDG